MVTKLKRILLGKVFTQTGLESNRNAINLKQMHFSYKHKESIFIVNLASDSKHNLEKGSKNHKNSECDQIAVDIDRNLFVKYVLENIRHEPLPNPKPKKIVIDFSSPNIAKPFHVGHLRSTIIGDWGTQFGLLQYGLQQKKITVHDLCNNPIQNLYEVYVHANKLASIDDNVQKQAIKYFSDIEQGRSDLENWRKIREITVHELEKIYHRLGITFDDYHWESDYNGEAIKRLMETLEKQNIITTDDLGKKVAEFKNRTITVLKSDNSTLYLSRDIAALLDRYKKYSFDRMLYVVDNAQSDHFAAVFHIVGKLNKECTEGCEHVKFGRIKGMSTRSGNVVFLNDILDEAKQKMFEKQQESKNTRTTAVNEETCDILGTTAVLINDLKQRRQKDYVFDWDRALQSEGDSGIKLQYLHCRLWSLEKNTGVTIPTFCNPDCLTEEIIGEVVAELARFEEILNQSLKEKEACIIVNYLFRLARHVNRMFNELNVKNVDKDLGSQRLLVFHSARIVIKRGLEILGVKPLCEM
ncbi:probable arginine--tRNA ligase, mitochondrial isoform X2 [Vanessa cardui]|uniref:probable arginine--tRNA ligase, mitochondrial isoform X2 n=1 Tax=Vanessa cardui TaxID=171605 RepID=UPI001F141AA8|nr:probable arginine--tRNA ligase, mitochondrial isoform X2 [Vanessa cardui]